ncbi:MAG: hypothetical protein GQF41_4143 [Candidatus Rifleibacterium amylolyticum]|nr:MAG: hypothetical protein GQF41_4143 [Candidatus Rifleibacterium amylolyticum]
MLFQSTRPRGARHFRRIIFTDLKVSIHAPAGGATYFVAQFDYSTGFNPRARGGRDQFTLEATIGMMFQSTRPRGARRRSTADLWCDLVSIHAPAGGATRPAYSDAPICSFNPRARGGRDVALARPRTRYCVSIHAPAGGATQHRDNIRLMRCFNPRARGGRDLPLASLASISSFQSTRPRGARPLRPLRPYFTLRFNPRARGGRDHLEYYHMATLQFQSTRPRGARHGYRRLVPPATVSIHAPAGGATDIVSRPKKDLCFNPRARGGRDLAVTFLTLVLSFQSTRPRGARP